MPTAQDIADDFNVVIVNANQLNPINQISQATLQAVHARHATFTAAVGNQLNRLINFLRWVALDGQPADRMDVLETFNTFFATTRIELPIDGQNGKTLAHWIVVRAALLNVPNVNRPYVKAFHDARNANAAPADIAGITYAAVAVGATVADALTVIIAIMKTQGADPAGITPVAMPSLITIYAQNRPRGGFLGFRAWGPGDRGTPAANLLWHLLKHVFCVNTEDDTNPTESEWWWRELGVSLTLNEYNTHATKAEARTRALFGGANSTLGGAELRKFLQSHELPSQPRLLAYLVSRYEDTYAQYALDQSRVLQNCIVHSNGVKVFVSGRAGSDVFVIGRVDQATNQLGISSCYRADNIQQKLLGAAANLCWPLR